MTAIAFVFFLSAAISALSGVAALGADGSVAKAPTPSFPGAAGFGAMTPGGRGGPVIAVRSLADSGPGTLRWALETVQGPRIVVFAVEGEINLSRPIFASGRLTLLGQVAPGAGVTVTGASLRIEGADVIVRGMRIRPGDGPGQDKEVRDAVTVGSRDRLVHDVVIDRNSLTWATDENVNLWHGVRDVTISNNIIAEGLRYAGHPKGRHSMGMLVGDGSTNITIARNLFISNEFRNPNVAKATKVEVSNNYVYNYGQHALSFTIRDNMFTMAHAIGNYFKRGPSSGWQYGVRIVGDPEGGRFYLADNISSERPNASYPEGAVASGMTWRDAILGAPMEAALSAAPLFPPSNLPIMSAHDVPDHVLANAGARSPHLDPVDARLVGEAASGGGGLINSPSELPPPSPDPAAGRAFPPDRDGDFVPDLMEAALGSDPETPDSHLPALGSPYAVIELYAHILATGG